MRKDNSKKNLRAEKVIIYNIRKSDLTTSINFRKKKLKFKRNYEYMYVQATTLLIFTCFSIQVFINV